MTTEIELGTETLFEGFELKLKGGMVENLNSGKITKGTIEVGVEGGIDGNIGPVKGEVKGGVATGIEITSAGIKEVYANGTYKKLEEKYGLEGKLREPTDLKQMN